MNTLYEKWIAGFSLCPVLTVPADTMDFASVDGFVNVIAEEADRCLAAKDRLLDADTDAQIEAAITIPFLHIADATAEAALDDESILQEMMRFIRGAFAGETRHGACDG